MFHVNDAAIRYLDGYFTGFPNPMDVDFGGQLYEWKNGSYWGMRLYGDGFRLRNWVFI